jgi:hypothetical protein
VHSVDDLLREIAARRRCFPGSGIVDSGFSSRLPSIDERRKA